MHHRPALVTLRGTLHHHETIKYTLLAMLPCSTSRRLPLVGGLPNFPRSCKFQPQRSLLQHLTHLAFINL